MGLDWQAQRPMRQLKHFDWALVVELQDSAWKVVSRIGNRRLNADRGQPEVLKLRGWPANVPRPDPP